MPTSPAKARKLLKQGKAVVYCKRPFTIQLTYKTGGATQEVTLGVDTGSQNIGIGITSGDRELYKAEIYLRNSMEKRSLLETRATFRRNRRYRNTRYRHPKYRFHTKRVCTEELVTRKSTKKKTHWKKETNAIDTGRPKGWLPPSIQSKVQHHIDWIDRYLDVLPTGTRLRIEVARFDMARMKDPTIHGELYQKGPQYDYENLKAYVFARDNYKCRCCGKKAGHVREDGTTVKLLLHHIDFRSKSSTDNPARCASVCDKCHASANHRPGGILYDWMLEEKKFSRGFRDSTLMNIVRVRLMAQYPYADFTYGNITAIDRKRLMLEKNHANDAIAVAIGNGELRADDVRTICFRQVRKKKRSLHEASPRKGLKTPNQTAQRHPKNMKQSKGFCLWDKVLIDGQIGWISGFSGYGQSARIVNANQQYIRQVGRTYSTHPLSALTLLGHNNNWITYAKTPAIPPTTEVTGIFAANS